MEDEIKQLKQQIETLQNENKQLRSKPTNVKVKKPRKQSEYNIFMKDALKYLREKHPDYEPKKLMSLAAGEWQKRKSDILTIETELRNKNPSMSPEEAHKAAIEQWKR